ncbi:unnamed protein product [Phaeothamnion confervicola]
MATIRRIQAEVAAAAVISSQSAVGGGVGAPPVVVAAAGPEGAGGTAPSPMGRGRGRGRGLSNLPAWLTKQSAAAAGSGSDLAGAERPAPSGAAGRFEDAAEAGGSRGSAGGEDGGAFATRLMANMGYREGEGLGRERQGISRPLQAQAVGNGQGVVGLHADDRRRSGPSGAEAGAAAGGAEGVPPEGGTRRKRGLFSNPTCVLLLKVRGAVLLGCFLLLSSGRVPGSGIAELRWVLRACNRCDLLVISKPCFYACCSTIIIGSHISAAQRVRAYFLRAESGQSFSWHCLPTSLRFHQLSTPGAAVTAAVLPACTCSPLPAPLTLPTGCSLAAEHGRSRRGGREPGGRDQGRVRKVRPRLRLRRPRGNRGR